MNHEIPIPPNMKDNADTIDIRSKGEYPSCALSNYAKHYFMFDGVPCNSMEGLLQSFKFADPAEQRKICKLTGKEAKLRGQLADWKSTQRLYWKGTVYERLSDDYQRLVTRAYDALYESETFLAALHASMGMELEHTLGKNLSEETILTTGEFLNQLNRLREKHKADFSRERSDDKDYLLCLRTFKETLLSAEKQELNKAFNILLSGTDEQLCKLGYFLTVGMYNEPDAKTRLLYEKYAQRWMVSGKWSYLDVPVNFVGYTGSQQEILTFRVNMDCFEEECPIIAFIDEHHNDYSGEGVCFLKKILYENDHYNLYAVDRNKIKERFVSFYSDSDGEFTIKIGHYTNGSIQILYNNYFCCK